MKRNLILLSSITLIATIFTGCTEEEVIEEKIPYVKIQKVSQNNLNTENIYSGKVCGRYETKLSFQVGGKIIKRNVDVGNQVSSGDLLMLIDSKDIVEKSNQVNAQVTSAIAELKLAETNFKRYKQLYEQEAIPASTLDQYRTTYESAEAKYKEAIAISNQSSNELTYTNLIANANGVITEINAEVGQVVSEGQTVLTLIQTDELEVEINVPENKLAEATVGKEVKIKFWALTDEINGVIREVSPMADSNSKTYKVKISLINVPSTIQLGMTASVILSGESATSTGMILPLSAIYQTDNQPKVWIVEEDNTVKLKDIKVEQLGDNEVEVSGVNANDLVVVAGVNKLRDGQKVQMKDKEQ